MKILKFIFIILVVFFKTGNLFSDNNLFSVNNILLEKKDNTFSSQPADKAIKEAFDLLIKRILLKEDIQKLSELDLSEIKKLVSYYNILRGIESTNKINYNVTFDREKMHELFLKKEISYSDISDKDLFILPILVNKNKIFIFNNNYFYDNWNFDKDNDLIEFILLLENIEILQKINQSRDDLTDLNLNILFEEYSNKNVAIIIIDDSTLNEKKAFLKAKIQNKVISKNLDFKSNNQKKTELEKKIIYEMKDEITNLIKSKNLIDISTPSFINVKLNLDKRNNLVLLKSKIKNIELIENIFVQDFNKNYVNVKIKYLGKLEKIIKLLKNENIVLKSNGNEWVLEAI